VIPDRHRFRNEKRGSGGTDRRLDDAVPIALGRAICGAI
jgi:hypothetical protein